jgi:hypothetical protein
VKSLRYLSHGPLLFWIAVSATLSSITMYAMASGSRQPDLSAAVQEMDQSDAWSSVEGWRASLSQLPVAVAAGDVSTLAKELARSASTNADAAERAGRTELAAAWKAAAEASDTLAKADAANPDELWAASHAVSLSSDRLAAVVNGLDWVVAPSPKQLPISTSSPEDDLVAE